LQHFFFDGNEKRIVWEIRNNESKIQQIREHVSLYLNKVTKEQSKIIALHVGLFWGIGKFIIKNKEEIKVMIDNKIMFQFLTKNVAITDKFIQTRIHFINQLIKQRELNIDYKLIESKENHLSKLI